jgi:hypothetical protein
MRPDVEIVTPFSVDFLNIHSDGITILDYDDFGGYNDRFAIVPFCNCKYYSHRIEEIAEFRKTNGRITSEKYAKFIIDKYFQQIKFIHFEIKLVRP